MTITIAVFTGEKVTLFSVIFAILIVAIYVLLNKIKISKNKALKTEKQFTNNIQIGFYLAIANIISLLFALLYYNFLIK